MSEARVMRQNSAPRMTAHVEVIRCWTDQWTKILKRAFPHQRLQFSNLYAKYQIISRSATLEAFVEEMKRQGLTPNTRGIDTYMQCRKLTLPDYPPTPGRPSISERPSASRDSPTFGHSLIPGHSSIRETLLIPEHLPTLEHPPSSLTWGKRRRSNSQIQEHSRSSKNLRTTNTPCLSDDLLADKDRVSTPPNINSHSNLGSHTSGLPSRPTQQLLVSPRQVSQNVSESFRYDPNMIEDTLSSVVDQPRVYPSDESASLQSSFSSGSLTPGSQTMVENIYPKDVPCIPKSKDNIPVEQLGSSFSSESRRLPQESPSPNRDASVLAQETSLTPTISNCGLLAKGILGWEEDVDANFEAQKQMVSSMAEQQARNTEYKKALERGQEELRLATSFLAQMRQVQDTLIRLKYGSL